MRDFDNFGGDGKRAIAVSSSGLTDYQTRTILRSILVLAQNKSDIRDITLELRKWAKPFWLVDAQYLSLVSLIFAVAENSRDLQSFIDYLNSVIDDATPQSFYGV